MADSMTPEQVATLERAIGSWLTFSPLREWAILMLQGNDVPTIEQWEAAERLAALTRNDAHPDSIVAKLANIISTPQPPPLPEIAACPYCGGECGCYSAVEHGRDMTGWYVSCQSRGCPYVSPPRINKPDTIESHNAIARKLREPEPVNECSTCRNAHEPASHPSCRICINAATGQHPAWEPKP